jgi:hypothetical protein
VSSAAADELEAASELDCAASEEDFAAASEEALASEADFAEAAFSELLFAFETDALEVVVSEVVDRVEMPVVSLGRFNACKYLYTGTNDNAMTATTKTPTTKLTRCDFRRFWVREY